MKHGGKVVFIPSRRHHASNNMLGTRVDSFRKELSGTGVKIEMLQYMHVNTIIDRISEI